MQLLPDSYGSSLNSEIYTNSFNRAKTSSRYTYGPFIHFKMTTTTPSEWYKDQFFISTSQALLQPEVVNAAFDSDYMFWCNRVSAEAMKRMLSHSLCFGVYALPESSSEIAGQHFPKLSQPLS
jgi:hypothetical protein